MSTPPPTVLTPGTPALATDAFGDDLPCVITRGPWREKKSHVRTEFVKVTVRFDPDTRDRRGVDVGDQETPWPAEFVRPVASTATKAETDQP